MDGAAELTRTLLSVSEVPLDMSARTQIRAAYGDRLLTWHLRRLKGGLKCVFGLT